jgi:hypothetical protein
MTTQSWSGLATLFPRATATGRPGAEALIAEARERGRRRRRRLALLFLVVAGFGVYGVDHWTHPGRAAVDHVSSLPKPCSLLSNAQVATIVGGSVATRTSSSSYGDLNCTWSSPRQGYMQFRQTFSVDIARATKTQFKRMARRSIPPLEPISGVGAPAYGSGSFFNVWKDGIVVQFDGTLVNVYPQRAIALARAIVAHL